MEAGTSVADCLGIFRHLPIQLLIGTVIGIVNRIKAAGSDAPPAPFAFVIVNDRFVLHIGDGVASAFFGTSSAAPAKLLLDRRFPALVLLHLPCPASASHADIFDCAAKACSLMAFKMAQADKYIRIHNRPPDLGCLAVLPVYHRDLHLIRSPKAVADDNLAACSHRVEPVEIGTIHMLQRILAASRIQGIAVCQKRHPALVFTQICYDPGIIRPQKRHVAKLAEMHLDRHKFPFHIQVLYAGCYTQTS